MNTQNKVAGLLAALFVGLVLGVAALSGAHAQQGLPAGGSYGNESIGVVTSVSGASAQALIAAKAGLSHRVKSLSFSSDTAGVLELTDGSGGAVIWSRYVAANVPYDLDEKNFRSGPSTSSGNGLYVIQPLLPSGSQKITVTAVAMTVPK